MCHTHCLIRSFKVSIASLRAHPRTRGTHVRVHTCHPCDTCRMRSPPTPLGRAMRRPRTGYRLPKGSNLNQHIKGVSNRGTATHTSIALCVCVCGQVTCDPLQASSRASQSPSVVTSPIAYGTSVTIFAKSSRFRINIIRRKLISNDRSLQCGRVKQSFFCRVCDIYVHFAKTYKYMNVNANLK